MAKRWRLEKKIAEGDFAHKIVNLLVWLVGRDPRTHGVYTLYMLSIRRNTMQKNVEGGEGEGESGKWGNSVPDLLIHRRCLRLTLIKYKIASFPPLTHTSSQISSVYLFDSFLFFSDSVLFAFHPLLFSKSCDRLSVNKTIKLSSQEHESKFNLRN